ncbi:MAG: hypothetical protein NC191_08190 [Muribaculaceae bacterium]|nr:hypothetical protein [Muribaculaceae bacterium]
MVNTYTASNYGVPVGHVADFNNTNPSHKIRKFKATEQITTPVSVPQNTHSNFASAVYGDGPYSLNHPNQKSEILAQSVDYIA